MHPKRPAQLVLVCLLLLQVQCGRAPGPQILVIGLDGATWERIDPWIAEGKLPNLARLRDRSAFGTLTSVLPTLSPPAWTSAVTGVNPGRHGIFDFQKRRVDREEIISETAHSRRAEPIWNYLKGRGPKVCVINVPMTDPPDEVDGVMVSGFPHLDDRKWIWPEDREQAIEDSGYLRDRMQMHLPEGQEEAILDSLLSIQEKRFELARTLYRERSWDLFWVVFTQTDRVQHLFWKFDDEESPFYDPALAAKYGGSIERLWIRCDQLLGELLELVPEDSWILVLSDHGFGPIHREIRIRDLLEDPESGFDGSEIQDVYVLDRSDAERLYIREQFRNPFTTRSPEQVEVLRGKLRARLETLRDPRTGENPILAVYDRSSIYSGNEAENAPDLTLLPKRGYRVTWQSDWSDRPALEEKRTTGSDGGLDDGRGRSRPDGNATFGDPQGSLSGWHRLNGVFMLAGPGVAPGPVPATSNHTLYDIVPTCLYALDQPIPEDLDGKVMAAAFAPEFLASRAPEYEGELEREDRRRSEEEEDEAPPPLPYIFQSSSGVGTPAGADSVGAGLAGADSVGANSVGPDSTRSK